jgi:hypothetical protein
MHGKPVSTGLDADDDVPGSRFQVIRLLVGDAVFLFDQRCEDVTVPGIDRFGVQRV